jgi:organic radical activating enzyme
MKFEEALARMRAPRNMFVICIDVTNKCDLACSNCTRLLANQDELWEMTPENFRLALQSLKGYWGIIAMIGGNPCMHSKFPELCRIFEEEIPNKLQRGLWTNNPFKHEALCSEVFGTFNLNAHGEQRAQPALQRLTDRGRQDGAVVWTYMGNSIHAPLLTAVKDVYPDEETMWDKIAACDINRDWSASIVQNRHGELRTYFCEVAASFDMARGGDFGYPLKDGWWEQHLDAFQDQVKRFCPGCGVPAKQKGALDKEERDTYTQTNADIALKDPKRHAEVLIEAQTENRRVTAYGSGTI